MSTNGFGPNDEIHSFRRVRYLLDIIALVAVAFLLDLAVEIFVQWPRSLEAGLIFDALGKMLLVAIGWGLIRFRGERLADIGLKRPSSWGWTIATGIGLAAIIFIAIYASEKAGFHRTLSRFQSVQGDLHLTVVSVFYSFVGAGFYEEFMFRGFLMRGLAMLFGGGRYAWTAACIVQAVAFGALHSYQNPLGVLISGTIGILLGFLVLRCRNLWAAIIAHGFYDAGRFVLFYFHGLPAA